MKVDVVQKRIDTERSLDKRLSPYYNTVKDTSFCCTGMKKFFKDGVIGIQLDEDYYEDDYDSDEPFVGIRQIRVIDTGYESWDGEDEIWIPDYEEEEFYCPIKKCPCCGEDIKVDISVVDVTDEVNDKLKMLPKSRRKKADKELAKEIYEDINKIVGKKVY